MTRWTKMLMTAGLALAGTSGIASAQAVTTTTAPVPGQAPVAGQPAGGQNGAAGALAGHREGDLPGPIDSLTDLQDSGRMLFAMADVNNDGLISQKEATDALNLMVGGFFFRADADGNGALSADEAKQAREALFAQQPVLRYVFQTVKQQGAQNAANNGNNNAAAAATNPVQAIGGFLDANNDKQVQATEVKQAIQTAVQGVFAVADTNRDNQLSPTEINAAILGAARTAAQAAFQQADADRNGSLSREEFDKAMVQPANTIFALLDLNNDGQISPEEAQRARQVLGQQMRGMMIPEPANSARNLLRTGVNPNQVAPVPNIPAPGAGAAPGARP